MGIFQLITEDSVGCKDQLFVDFKDLLLTFYQIYQIVSFFSFLFEKWSDSLSVFKY
jgi:hypothetical protein